jgi:hypothetical protein
MKTMLLVVCVCVSVSAIAQPTVSGNTFPSSDTVIVLPATLTLTGTALESNPGHPILDTTWSETSGPAATITNPSNRMTTTVTGLTAGTYLFTLTATDKQKAATASVKVTVISGVLGAELAYFNISRNDNGVLVTWQTDMESKIARFVIQESSNGSDFYDIATISSKANGGNSSIPLTYTYQISNSSTQADMHTTLVVTTMLSLIVLFGRLRKLYKCLLLGIICLSLFSCTKSNIVSDKAATSGTIAYRLKQVSMDNTVNYSEIKLLNGN